MLEKLGGRKFLAFNFVVILSFVLVLLSKMTVDLWVEIIKWATVTFIAGNAVVHLANGIKK